MTTLDQLTVKAGDTVTLRLTITDDAGVPIDLTGATVTAHVRAQGATTDTLNQALALTTPTLGIATLTLSAAQTATLTPRKTYRYEIECVDGALNVTTPVEGLLYCAEDWG